MNLSLWARFLLLLSIVACPEASLAADGPVITKIDPPNWWSSLPAPMLLIQGDHLSGAKFTFSDRALHVDKSHISANGHWAELWLNASPSGAESVRLSVHTRGGETSAPYRFQQRRAATDGLAGFSSHDAMYLIMTDRFADGDVTNDGADGAQPEQSADAAAERAKVRGWHGGDLRGILDHLDYIQKTGFTTVWITPVYANRNEGESYHGYGATDMYAVDPHYGDLADLKSLEAELHRRHMKLVLDTVPNHVGPQHPWVDDEPDSRWLHGTKDDHHEAVGDFRSLVDPHAPWRDQRYVLQGWFANVLPDLNQENPATEQYLIQNAIWWIEQVGADGLRIDTFPYVARPFWHDFHAQIHFLYPSVTTVGEIFNCDATITSSFAGGVTRNGPDTGLDTPFDFPTYCALRDVFQKGEPMTRLSDVWRLDSLYPHPERLIPFLGNHDNARFLSGPGATAGNMQLAFAVLLTMRGMPQIYSGDEIGMTGGEDPDNRRDFPGGWPAATQSAFTHPNPDQLSMWNWVRRLLALRGAYPALQDGAMQVLSADKDVLAYARVLPSDSNAVQPASGSVLVVVNRSSAASTVKLELAETLLAGSAASTTLLGDATPHWNKGKDTALVDIPGNSVWIALLH